MYVPSYLRFPDRIGIKPFLFPGAASLITLFLFWNYPLHMFSVVVASVFFFLTFKYPEIGLAIIVNGLFLIGIFWKSFEIPYFVTPAAVTLCAFALLHYVSNKGLNWKFGMIPAVVLLLGVVLLFGIFYSPVPGWGLIKTGRYLSMNVFIFFGVLLFTGDLERLKNLLKAVAFLGFILTSMGLLYVHYMGLESISRLTLPGQNPIWFARGLGLSIISTLFLLELTKKALDKVILLIFVFLMLFLIYLTASRGPALSLLISLFFYFFIVHRGWSNLFRRLFYAFLVFLSLKLFVAAAPKAIWGRMISLFGGFDLTVFLRWNAYKTAFNLFLKHPLAGVGTGGYADYDKLLRYPHNIFLELACEHGIFVVSIFLGVVSYTFYIGIRLLKEKNSSSEVITMAKVLLTLLVFTFLNSQVSGALHGNFELWFALAGIWVIFSTRRKVVEKK